MASLDCNKHSERTDRFHSYENNYNYDNVIQEKLESPMPWIGMYIAAASAVCSIAMAADAFNGFRSKKLWFPCKYFSLNAFSLTVLAVAMKLPVDLTSQMIEVNDILVRLSSLGFMSTALANCMTCLGSMEGNEIILNVAAIGTLVITIMVNVIVHNAQMISVPPHLQHFTYVQRTYEEVGSTFLMFVLLVTFCSSTIMVPTARKHIELAYQEMHIRVSNDEADQGTFAIDELIALVRKYSVMTHTGSPQFVIVRSVACVTPGIMCLLADLVLLEAYIRLYVLNYWRVDSRSSSNYKWSISWILYIQSIGIALGTIAPISRWFIAAKFKSSMIGRKSFKDHLKVESYWTQILVDWRDSPLPVQTQYQKVRKNLHDAKKLVMNFCIGLQVVIVRAGKLLLLISASCVKVILLCFRYIKNSEESGAAVEQDVSRYIVLLEGEAELPKKTLRSICNEVDKLIEVGGKKKPKNLIQLLNKSVNFNGVREFDSEHIQSLRSQEPPNCWSLPIVTLASIAVALPNITTDKSNQLLRSVGEGLYFVKLIEKALDRNGELASVRNAADFVWVGVELYHRWLDISLQNTLQELSDTAKKIVMGFETTVRDPLSWPIKVIAANSMYRISQTILGSHVNNDSQTEDDLLERLSIMISDILSACLTNLPRVITLECRSSAIKEREKRVMRAALLLGEGKEILQILQQRKLPCLDPEKAAYIEEWRVIMGQDNGNHVSASAPIQTSNEDHVSVELEG